VDFKREGEISLMSNSDNWEGFNINDADPAHNAFWGGYSGHFQDPDGHLWEVVWNPEWNFTD